MKKQSLQTRERNRQIRTRMALGESAKTLAEDYDLTTATIHAINKGYKGSGYEFSEFDYLSADLADLRKLILSHGLAVHIDTFVNSLSESKKKRTMLFSQFNEICQLYQNADPGSVNAQISLQQISHFASKLLLLEVKISTTLASIQAICSSLSTAERYKPCAKSSKKSME